LLISQQELDELKSYGKTGEKAVQYIHELEQRLVRIRNNFQLEDGPEYPRKRPPKAPTVIKERKKQRRGVKQPPKAKRKR
jgi:hypothetical protein